MKQPTQPNQMDDKQNLGGVRVLVVEDDLDTLEMLKVILQNRGAEVITASSAGDALKALEHSLPDALVSDLAMPEQDGYELIEHIRQRGPERGGNIPAVALTAYARVEDRVRALTAGFQMYVPKPVDPNELVAVVANLTHPYLKLLLLAPFRLTDSRLSAAFGEAAETDGRKTMIGKPSAADGPPSRLRVASNPTARFWTSPYTTSPGSTWHVDFARHLRPGDRT